MREATQKRKYKVQHSRNRTSEQKLTVHEKEIKEKIKIENKDKKLKKKLENPRK